MKLRANKPARENGSRILPRLGQQFFTAMDSAIDGELDAEQAHRLRLLAKRFRYSMEYFRPCYGETMDAYLNHIGDLQRAMGKLTDCSSSRALFRELLPGRARQRQKKLFEALKRREEEQLDVVRSLWRDQLANSLTRKRFLRYLARPAAPRPAPPVAEIGGSLRALPAQLPHGQHYH